MEYVSSFPGIRTSEKPKLNRIRPLFFFDFPNAWTEDADITIYFDDGAYTVLTIVVNPSCGVWLRYNMIDADGKEKNFFSLGNEAKLDSYVDAVEDALTLEGLYIQPQEAWLAVKDFVDYNGTRSQRIPWISECELPEGRHWLVATDCL